MVVLQGALPGTDTPAARVDRAGKAGAPDDDLSGRAHRQLIGSIGLLMPVLLWLIAGLFPSHGYPRWATLGSISAYYYTAGVVAFIGLLVGLSLYLFAYQGFDNQWKKWDILCARVAAVAALGVAFLPCSPPDATQRRPWWLDWMVYGHYGSAALLFSAFAVFSLWLFTRTDPQGYQPADKKWRNWVYRTCGLIIIAGMVGVLVMGVFLGQPIWLPESAVLVAFAVSWLVKGSIHKTAKAIKQKVLG